MRRPLTPDQIGARVLGACAVVLLLALGGAMAVESWQRRSAEEIERDHPGQEQLVALVDATDPLTQAQAAQLEDHLRRVVETQLQPGDVVTLWTLGLSLEGQLHRALRLHMPPRESNPLYQNPREVAGHYDAIFVRPMHAVLAGLSDVSPARWSPIVEAIGALTELPDLRGRGRSRFVLVSDLEQHSRLASFLARQPSFRAFRRMRAGSALPDLHGIAVEIVVIPRPGQDLRLEASRAHFWAEYFRAAGASSVAVERL